MNSPNKTNVFDKNNGVYMQIYILKDGVRYDMETISLHEVSNILTNSLMDGIEKICK